MIYKVMLIKDVDPCPGLSKLVVSLVKIQGLYSHLHVALEECFKIFSWMVSGVWSMSPLLAAGR